MKSLDKLKRKLNAPRYRTLRLVLVTITGTIVTLLGVAMIFFPGPAFIVIPAGIAILALEFQWARRWKDDIKEWMDQMRAKFKRFRAAHR